MSLLACVLFLLSYLHSMKKIALITGATSGFGKACAVTFAANEYHLVLNGRRTERLENLKKELEKTYAIKCLLVPFDVRLQQEVFSAIETSSGIS